MTGLRLFFLFCLVVGLLAEYELCGNGRIDAGEQCDPAIPGSDCCSLECRFISEKQHKMCRSSSGFCDTPEFCNGRHAYCPADAHRENGVPCAKYMTCCDGGCQPAGDRCPRNKQVTAHDLPANSKGFTDVIAHHPYRVSRSGNEFGRVFVDPHVDVVVRPNPAGKRDNAELEALHMAQTGIHKPLSDTYIHSHPEVPPAGTPPNPNPRPNHHHVLGHGPVEPVQP